MAAASHKRRTKIGGGGGEDMEFVAEDFIVDEQVTVSYPRRLMKMIDR